MSPEMRVLFVDDTAIDVMFEQDELSRHGLSFRSRIAANETELKDALVQFEPDIVLCDYTMPGFSCLDAIRTLHRFRPSLPVIMVSGSIADDTAIECLDYGAVDYILKSNLRRLGPAVRRAVSDSRHHQALEARIDELANFDRVTGLPTLDHLRPALLQVLDRALSRRSFAALVVVNLDDFRFVDEQCGRAASDLVLRDVADTLRAQAGPADHVARVGPNEFLVALGDLVDAQNAAVTVKSLLSAIALPRLAGGRMLQVEASAGIAIHPSDGTDLEALLHNATHAVHTAKAVSRGGVQFYSGDEVQHARSRRRLEAGLREAILDEKLTLHYQPQFDIGTGRACGAEALARWFPARGSAIAPAIFIPLAEQTGQIASLGAWVVRSSCRTWAAWAAQRTGVPVSVNVSPRQISEAFTAEIAAALQESGLPADQLELEITESILVSRLDVARQCMAQWKRLGVRIALDDFGIGYSNLGYLAKLPFDRLKIDGSLISGIATGSKDVSILRAVISLGRELGFTVIAECVETEDQLRILGDLGCQQAQGFLLSPPVAANEVPSLLRSPWGARVSVPPR